MTSHAMGSDVGTNLELVEKYSRAISSITDIPIIAKMTPNITVMEPAAIAAVKGGAKGISATNTVKSITSMDYESMTGMPVVNGVSSISGYSRSGDQTDRDAFYREFGFLQRMGRDPSFRHRRN